MNFDLAETFASGIDFIIFLLPVAIPILLIVFIWEKFVGWRRAKYTNGLKFVLLEITPPAEVKRSPAAMELFLHAVHSGTGETTWYDRNFKGQYRAQFSLELASIEGRTKFFIRCQIKHKTYIESQLYAHFSGIEINENEDDYTAGFTVGKESNYDLFGVELGLTKEDPYPIKTYIDYNLDKEQDDDFRIDPMAGVMEFFNTVSPGGNVWIQIIIKAHKSEDLDPDKLFPSLAKKRDAWKDTADKKIEELREAGFLEMSAVDEDGKKTRGRAETMGQKDTIAALERSVSKLAFDTGIRMLYLYEKDKFQGSNIGGMLGGIKQYNSVSMNGFKPVYMTDFDWPWQDIRNRKINKMKAEMLEAYKDRQYFFKDRYDTLLFFWLKSKGREPFVLNTEELATIYHFPGRVSESPSLKKVDSKRGAPPGDLPI